MIPYGHQSIDESDVEAVVQALKSDWLTTGPRVEKFESAIENVVGAPSIVVSSGTAALHCAYEAIGIKPGDEIITPPITFIATQATAALMGARIVFADVQPDTANIDPEVVESLISTKTKAIVAVDYGGHPAAMSELRELADKHGLFLIEDAAHSIGSLYKGSPVGTLADITTFSFFPTKNLTTAEGGAVASIRPDLLRKAKEFSRQGLVRDPARFRIRDQGPWHQEVHEFGLNYRLPDVLCALGLSQIERLDDFKILRKRIFEKYSSELAKSGNIMLPVTHADVDPMWHLFSIRVDPLRRKKIFENMRGRGIGVQVNYIPAYWHPVFEDLGYKRGLCPNAELYYQGQISLPMYTGLTDSDQDFVIKNLLELVS